MKTLVVHAGMMKTGSTSIQVSLSRRPQAADYHYIFHHSNNSSMPMRIAFARSLPPVIRHPMFSRAGYRASFLKYLSLELQRDVPRLIISGEMISATFQGPDYVAMRNWFTRHIPQTRIVVYVREAGSFMESIYQQMLKEFGHGEARPMALYPKYRRRFEPMEQAFGAENITYRTFDPTSLVGGDIVLDFASVVGFEFSEADVVRANDSLSIRAASLLHVYHRHLPAGQDIRLDSNPLKRRLIRLLSEVRGPKLRLAHRVIEPILKRQEEDIAWMSGRLDQPMPTYRPAPEGAGVRGDADLTSLDPIGMDWLCSLAGRRIRPEDGAEVATALAELASEHGFQNRLVATRRIFSLQE